MSATSNHKHSCRKWSGVILLVLEVNLVSGTIFGFSALFKVLPNYGIYDKYCTSPIVINSTMVTEKDCDGQTKQYQNALTLGFILYNLMSVFVGVLSDVFGDRFIKLIGIIFHVIGWLALALVKPGRDYLLYIHTAFTSLSGSIVSIIGCASCGYFSTSRAFLSSLFAGAFISATMWYSIFQVLIDADRLTLAQLSYIWISLGFLMFITAFLYVDWRFPLLNLPYKFDTKLEQPLTMMKAASTSSDTTTITKTKWYENMYQRVGVWEHLTSPLYILVVLFLSVLVMPSVFLSVTWYPWVYYVTNQNTSLANKYTFAFNMSTLVALAVCPINGFVLGFRANRSRAQKLLNILIVQTITWLLNIAACTVCMFMTTTAIIPVLVINCIARAMKSLFSFPSEYIGTLIGVMWTVAGVVIFIQYGLIKLTEDIPKSWRAWLILLISVTLMSCHLVQIGSKYVDERRNTVPNAKLPKDEILDEDVLITKF